MGALIYRTSDGSKTEYVFSLESAQDGAYRAYVLGVPAGLRADDGAGPLPGTAMENGRSFVDAGGPVWTLEEGKIIAALWADRMQERCRTGRCPTAFELVSMYPDNAVYGRLRDTLSRGAVDERALFEALSAEVYGQEPSLATLARRVAQHLARRAPRRPLTVMALGPTGVGKTRTAKVLADALPRAGSGTPGGYSFARLDMNEYAEAHRVSQLFGAPQGYVGYGDGAELADALSASPRTLVLLDEIDKAHPKVLHALMNAMDAGRLSSAFKGSHGRVLDFREAILFFTSNLGARGVLEALGGASSPPPEVVDDACRTSLGSAGVAPALLGRIQTFLVFRPLSPAVRSSLFSKLVVSAAEEYGLHLVSVSSSVVSHLLERAGDNRFGVRPDEYLVDEVLGPWLARAAAQRPEIPLRLIGPPFRFVRCDPGHLPRLDTTEVPDAHSTLPAPCAAALGVQRHADGHGPDAHDHHQLQHRRGDHHGDRLPVR